MCAPSSHSGLAAPAARRACPRWPLRPEAIEYQRVAELGLFTPPACRGTTRVGQGAQQLQSQGALIVDTRTEKEFKTRRIKGAQWAAYIEKSLKDVAFNAVQDDFSALDKLPAGSQDKPVIFACNGAECWKSYQGRQSRCRQGIQEGVLAARRAA